MRVLVLLALVGAALAAPKHITKIVGGEATTIEQYPYMSNMLYNRFGSFNPACGGALITTTSVLSAGHCYAGDSAWRWQARLGSSLASSGGQVIPASRLVLHAKFDLFTLLHDIAIVKLTSAAELSASVAVARIPGPNYILPDGSKIVATGWGALQFGGDRSEQLQHVTVDTINQELCAQRYRAANFPEPYEVTDLMLCAGILDVGGKDTCQGDSGGPLAHDFDVIVGITSWGFRCADDFFPGVNTRVSSFSNWIVTHS